MPPGTRFQMQSTRKYANELFIAEDFETAAVTHAASSSSLAKFIGDLQEPSIDGKHCIPWLGEVATKEKILRLCAAGKLAINVRGLELLQAQPGETEDAAWMRIKGKLGSGKELEQTILYLPSAYPQSGGTLPLPLTPATSQPPTPPSVTGTCSAAQYIRRQCTASQAHSHSAWNTTEDSGEPARRS